jgi:Zn-dependent protease
MLCTVVGGVGVHELGHVAAVTAVGGRVTEVAVSLVGGSSTRWEGAPGRRAAVSVILAGPMANVVVAIGANRLGGTCWTMLGRANLIVAAGNLIPIGGSDGSQLLDIVAKRNVLKAADDD